ncbi:MAG TPA: hypothetical protein VFP23_01660 [Solirubrobacterales bacterium]|nr:hypothetical protein [Solirubrobacterales bacterium]
MIVAAELSPIFPIPSDVGYVVRPCLRPLVGELERRKDSYRLCYVRGPEGIIVELAEKIG